MRSIDGEVNPMSVFSKRKTGIFHFVFEKKRYNRINKRVCTNRGATAP